MIRRILFLVVVSFLGLLQEAHAQQAALETFGQNRIQNRRFTWQYYDSAHFRVFYYDYGKYNAQYVLQQAELDFPKIVGEMGVRMPRKINIILYNSYTDYKQTNTGRYNEELNLSNNAAIDISGNNVVVYFNGSHDDLNAQVRSGVVSIIKDNLLFGFKLKDVVQNAIKLQLPLWYTSGYTKYESTSWDATRASELRSMLQKGSRRADFIYYAEKAPELVGHSFFHFIEQHYSKSYINNLFYLTSNRKPINKSIQIVTKKSAAEIFAEWKAFYLGSPGSEPSVGARQLMFTIKPKPNARISNFALSPDGSQMAYCETIDGKYEVKLQGKTDRHAVVILEGGLRQRLELKDPSYPLMAWNKDGKKLAIMYERDYLQRLKVYDATRGRISDRVILPNKFDRLNGLSFMDDDDKLVISAIRKGQCDLYQYTIKNAQLFNITKDIWDELNPKYINTNDLKGVLFMSNRPQAQVSVKITNNELPNTNPNIFFYNDETGSSALTQFTAEEKIKISQPIQYGSTRVAFLADIGGKNQRIIANLVRTSSRKDSVYFTVSNPSNYNIKAHGYNTLKDMCFDVIETNGNIVVYATPYKVLQRYDDSLGYAAASYARLEELDNITLKDTSNIAASFFLSEFENDIDSMTVAPTNKNKVGNNPRFVEKLVSNGSADFRRFKNKKYVPTFSTDFLQTSIDNNLIFDRYQNLNTSDGKLATPPLGALLKMSLIDFLEDYKLTAGVRLPLAQQGIAYQIKFANYRRKLDWEVQAVYNKNVTDVDLRQNADLYSPVPEKSNQIQTYIQGMLSYPTSITTSIRFYTGIRQDKQRYKALSEYSIRFPTINEYWQFNRLEYVFDNTFSPLLNIRKGTRLKIYQDAYLKLNGANGNMFNSGLDVRHYQPLYRNAIFAVRLNTAHSYGTTPMLYKLGGVDNPILPGQYNINTDNMLMDTTKFGYQTQVTSMRGFFNNARQGSSFAVLSLEVRVPVVNTILNRQVRSRFLNTFQVVPFMDIGTAGRKFLDVASTDSRTNIAVGPTAFISSTKGIATTAQGIGLGARAMVGSYFVRLDYAKGTDRSQPMVHLSLSKDF
jgi:hypothetical protein